MMPLLMVLLIAAADQEIGYEDLTTPFENSEDVHEPSKLRAAIKYTAGVIAVCALPLAPLYPCIGLPIACMLGWLHPDHGEHQRDVQYDGLSGPVPKAVFLPHLAMVLLMTGAEEWYRTEHPRTPGNGQPPDWNRSLLRGLLFIPAGLMLLCALPLTPVYPIVGPPLAYLLGVLPYWERDTQFAVGVLPWTMAMCLPCMGLGLIFLGILNITGSTSSKGPGQQELDA